MSVAYSYASLKLLTHTSSGNVCFLAVLELQRHSDLITPTQSLILHSFLQQEFLRAPYVAQACKLASSPELPCRCSAARLLHITTVHSPMHQWLFVFKVQGNLFLITQHRAV